MKHPALVRLLAVALAIVSVLTLLSGAICVGKAVKDNNENLGQIDLLSEKTDNAALLLRQLEEGKGDFESTDLSLSETRDQYNQDMSDFRTELATHTATRAGLVLGRSALGTASAALKSGREQYEQGLAAYEEGAAAFDELYQQYLAAKEGLELGWAAYYEGVKQLEENSAELDAQRQKVETMLTAISATKETISQLKELIASLEEQLPEDQEAMEAKLKELEDLINELSPKLSEYEKQLLLYNAACALVEEADKLMARLIEEGYSDEEVKARADELCMEAFGMRYEELKLWLENNEPVLDEENQEIQENRIQIELTQEQYEALLKLLNENKDQLQKAKEALEAAEAQLAEQEAQLQAALAAMDEPAKQLALLKAQLEEGQKQLEAGEPAILEGKAQMDAAKAGLDAAKTALDEGEKQLNAGWGQMAAKEKELEEQAEELKTEKERLEGVYADIGTMEDSVDSYESLEDRTASAKAALTAYDGIARRVGQGGELIASANAELQEMQANGEKAYRGRLAMSILMILSGVFGILSVLVAFEKIRCRGLWLFVLAAALLSAGSELCSLLLGRGLLYTAIFVVIFGIILLPLTIERKKEKTKQS